jgi:hypothetical protein
MAIKEEIAALIKTLQEQLVNFEIVPEDRLEAFLNLCADVAATEDEQQRIEDRELQIVMLCIDAEVRSSDNIGHCGVMEDYVWYGGEWLDEEEVEERENEDEEDEDEDEDEDDEDDEEDEEDDDE